MGIVYLARNKISLKVYIGQTIWTLYQRKESHEIEAKRGSHLIFHQALKSYGFENFEWSVLFGDLEEEDLDVYEIAMIRKYDSLYPGGYNMTVGGEGRRGPLREESKELIRKALKGKPKTPEHLANMSAALKGRVFTPEWKRKISLNRRGKKRTPPTPEEREKISEGLRRAWREGRKKGRKRKKSEPNTPDQTNIEIE